MILDINSALEKSNGNEKLAKELFTMLIAEIPILMSQILESYDIGSLRNISNIAHKLHGSTAYSGVPELKQAAQDLENSVKNKDINDIKYHIDNVQAAISTLIEQAPNLIKKKWC